MAHTHEAYPEHDCVQCLLNQAINWDIVADLNMEDDK